MITLKLNEEKYKLPENWSEVSLGKFQQISNIIFESKLQYIVEILKIFTGLEESIIINIEKGQFGQLSKTLGFISNHEFKKTIIPHFEIDGITYTFKSLQGLTLGEVVSIETLIDQSGNNMINMIHKLIAILYQEGDKEWDASQVERLGNLFQEKLMINNFYNILVFFYHIEKEYYVLMRAYLENQKKKEKMKNQTKLIRVLEWIKSFIGSHWSRGWQMGISLSSKKSMRKTT